MYETLQSIHQKPEIFSCYTAESLWTDPHRAKHMLSFHLNEQLDVASRRLEFLESSVQWITSEFSLGAGKSVCDFGCGPGLYSSRLAKSGAAVTGIDFSRHSIDYAKSQAQENGLSINYIHKNYLQYDGNTQFDLIIMIMCDFCSLSPQQRKQLLQIFRKNLKPGGHILLDVYSHQTFHQKEEGVQLEKNHLGKFWTEEEYFCLNHTFKYDEEYVILDQFIVIDVQDRIERVYNWQQCFRRETLAAELNESGFTIQNVFADVAGTPYNSEHLEFAVVAEIMQS